MSLFGGVLPITGVTFLLFSVMIISVLGYLLGRITIKGVSLGTAGVFIIAILFGGFFYKALDAQLTVQSVSYTKNALKIVENIGLIFFVTAVGFIAGPKFFANMKKNFKSYVLLGLIIIVAGGLSAVGCIFIGRATGETDYPKLTAMVVGLLSGSLTSTPAFSAAKATVAESLEDIVSVGHGIAYIFGVIGVVLFVQLIPKFSKANMEEERKKIGAGTSEKKEEKTSETEEKTEAVTTVPGQIKPMISMDTFNFVPFFLAAVLGVLVGSIKIPLTGKGLAGTTFSLTTTGGCLLASLLMGHFGKIGRISLMPSEATLKVFRELGLMLFLVGAGISGGASFVANFQVIYFVYGVIMTLVPMIVGYIIAKYVLKMSLLNNLGSITGGMTSTPALGTLIKVAGTEDVAAAYAATYPVALIAVVLVSQFLIILF